MPEISRFYGVRIYMYANDHPPPHFHARYAEHQVLVRFDRIEIYRGSLPQREQSMVLEWAILNREQLFANWEMLRSGKLPRRIEPMR
jgi:hypothetical protein